MSTLIELKESINLSTGIIWFCTSISIWFFSSDLNLKDDPSQLKGLIELLTVYLTEIWIYIAILTFFLATILTYLLHFINISYMHIIDRKYNESLKKKERGNLNSYDFPPIQRIINKIENTLLLCVGSLILTIFSYNALPLILVSVPFFILLLQILAFYLYWINIERKSLSNLQHYYLLSKDEETVNLAKPFQNLVYNKDWGSLNSEIVIRLNSLERQYKRFSQDIKITISSFKERFGDHDGLVREELIWDPQRGTVPMNKSRSISRGNLVKSGFDYIFPKRFQYYDMSQRMSTELDNLQSQIRKESEKAPFHVIKKDFPVLAKLVTQLIDKFDEYNILFQELQKL